MDGGIGFHVGGSAVLALRKRSYDAVETKDLNGG